MMIDALNVEANVLISSTKLFLSTSPTSYASSSVGLPPRVGSPSVTMVSVTWSRRYFLFSSLVRTSFILCTSGVRPDGPWLSRNFFSSSTCPLGSPASQSTTKVSLPPSSGFTTTNSVRAPTRALHHDWSTAVALTSSQRDEFANSKQRRSGMAASMRPSDFAVDAELSSRKTRTLIAESSSASSSARPQGRPAPSYSFALFSKDFQSFGRGVGSVEAAISEADTAHRPVPRADTADVREFMLMFSMLAAISLGFPHRGQNFSVPSNARPQQEAEEGVGAGEAIMGTCWRVGDVRPCVVSLRSQRPPPVCTASTSGNGAAAILSPWLVAAFGLLWLRAVWGEIGVAPPVPPSAKRLSLPWLVWSTSSSLQPRFFEPLPSVSGRLFGRRWNDPCSAGLLVYPAAALARSPPPEAMARTRSPR
mmetsp:Transcript_109448/g.310411  ORF Transcript_109448/g.310411 Transcript_109448/m.310411 type:complete len:421 (-) Transcript_109448:71-1333(-)